MSLRAVIQFLGQQISVYYVPSELDLFLFFNHLLGLLLLRLNKHLENTAVSVFTLHVLDPGDAEMIPFLY